MNLSEWTKIKMMIGSQEESFNLSKASEQIISYSMPLEKWNFSEIKTYTEKFVASAKINSGVGASEIFRGLKNF